MTKNILCKLRVHLAKPVITECAVVYLLAEVRKLLERDDEQHRLEALWMHCHWALHVDLESPKTTGEFLKRVDLWVSNTVAYLLPSGPWQFQQEYYLFKDFIYLDAFRKQLRLFFVSHELPSDLCDIEERWFAFLSAYAGVIQDGTLAFEAKKSNELSAVKRVVFNKGKPTSTDNHVNFIIQWNIELKDGRTLRTEVEAFPSSPIKMTAHKLKVIQGTFVPPTISPFVGA